MWVGPIGGQHPSPLGMPGVGPAAAATRCSQQEGSVVLACALRPAVTEGADAPPRPWPRVHLLFRIQAFGPTHHCGWPWNKRTTQNTCAGAPGQRSA